MLLEFKVQRFLTNEFELEAQATLSHSCGLNNNSVVALLQQLKLLIGLNVSIYQNEIANYQERETL
mgnify:CR=1 FL=1